MNIPFLWLTVAIVTPLIAWNTYYVVRRFSGDTRRPGAGEQLYSLLTILAAAIFGYIAAGILGLIAAVASIYLLPVTFAFVVLIATGRVRRV
jgi:hypothetical protein